MSAVSTNLSPSDPIAAFDATVAALNAEDWRAAARLCDPVSLRVYHRNLIDGLTPVRVLTAEDLLRMSPDMPREAAEYQVAQHLRYTEPGARLREDFPSISSVEELRALSPVDAFAAWLDGRSIRRQVDLLVARGDVPVPAAELTSMRMLPTAPYVAIGVVHDGERLAHVLYRHSTDDGEEMMGEFAESIARFPADEQAFIRELSVRGHPQVITCRRQPDGTWALIADHNFLGIGAIGFSRGVRFDADTEADGASA